MWVSHAAAPSLTDPLVPTARTSCVDTTIANLLEGSVPFCPESGEDSADLPAPAPSPPAAGAQGSAAAPAKVGGTSGLVAAARAPWPVCRTGLGVRGTEHFNLETECQRGPCGATVEFSRLCVS